VLNASIGAVVWKIDGRAAVLARLWADKPPYFLLGLCVSADAAALFAAALDFGSRKTFEAAVAAFALVTSLFFFDPLIT
jgi:hypothetical protein